MWNEHLYQYCERGHSATFWAEPLNAISNLAFILAGLAAVYLLVKRPPQTSRLFCQFLTVMLFVIGIGSFLFHTFATRWAELGDVIPITIFVFSYLIFAVRTFLRQTWSATAIIMLIFVGISYFANSATCSIPASPPEIGDSACLWGSVAYFPPLAALWIIGAILPSRGHRASSSIIAAGAVFSVSLLLRTLDVPFCSFTLLGSKYVGTHLFWHCLNGCTLYILLRAAILYSGEVIPGNLHKQPG